LWDVASRKKIALLEGSNPCRCCCLAFSPDGRSIVAPYFQRGGETAIGVWGVDGKFRKASRLSDSRRILSLAVSLNGRTIAVSGYDSKNTTFVELLDLHSGRGERIPLTPTRNDLSPVAISPNGRLLAGG